MTTDGNIIKSKKVDKIQLTLLNRSNIMLSNVAFTPKYNSNFISFGQLKKVEILYHNHFKRIILKKTRNIIGLI